MGRLATRAPRELAFLNQVGEIGLDLLIGELIRRAFVVLGQLHDLADVRLVGAGGEATHRHVADHAGPKLAHETPPSKSWDGGDSRRAIVTTTSERQPREDRSCLLFDLPRQRFNSTSNSTELHNSASQHSSRHIVFDVRRANDESPRPDADLVVTQPTRSVISRPG